MNLQMVFLLIYKVLSLEIQSPIKNSLAIIPNHKNGQDFSMDFVCSMPPFKREGIMVH